MTARELRIWGIGATIPLGKLRDVLRTLLRSKKIYSDGRYIWVGHGHHRQLERTAKEDASRKKFYYASVVGKYIGHIPTVRLVTVTGSVAAGNASTTDDIDFLVVTSPGTVWLTRLCALVLIECIARRRHPYDREVANAICLNMFLGADAIGLPPEEHDIYSAYELLLMEPVYTVRGTYRAMLTANSWAKRFLPVAFAHRLALESEIQSEIKRPSWFIGLLESAADRIQTWYMRHRRTSEIIKENVIRFHPNDSRAHTLSAYHKRCIQYKIPGAPLDNRKTITVK